MFLKVNNEFDLLDFSPKYVQFLKRPEHLTYLLLRRKIRRSWFNKKTNEHLEKRDLVANVSFKELALLQGVSIARISQNISELKNKWKVLKTGPRTGRELIFILGGYGYKDGKRTERYYDGTFVKEAQEKKREKELMEKTKGRKISLEEFLTNKIEQNLTQNLGELNTEFSEAKVRLEEKPLPEGVCSKGIESRIANLKDKKDLPLEAKGTQKNLPGKTIKEDGLTQKSSLPSQGWFHQGLSSQEVVASRYPQAYGSFKKKSPAEYNSNNLLILFCIEYHKKYGMMYSPSGNGANPFGGKDSSNLKVLLTGQSPEIMAKVIPYFMKNYEKIESLPKDRPSVSILYGWRNTIIPNCLLGEPKGSAAERGRRGEITDEEWEEERNDAF